MININQAVIRTIIELQEFHRERRSRTSSFFLAHWENLHTSDTGVIGVGFQEMLGSKKSLKFLLGRILVLPEFLPVEISSRELGTL